MVGENETQHSQLIGMNNYLRTGFNYVHVMELSGGSYADTNLDAVQVRMQLAF